MSVNIQQILVILIGLGCLALIVMRIYHAFSTSTDKKSPCDNCPTGCDLQRVLKEKQRDCDKKGTKRKKSCCG